MKSTIFLAGLISLAPVQSTEASFRCKGQLLEGFLKIDVLRYCGEPILRSSYNKSVNHLSSPNSTADCEVVEQWSYVQGADKRSYTLEIEQGRVVRIIDGEKSP